MEFVSCVWKDFVVVMKAADGREKFICGQERAGANHGWAGKIEAKEKQFWPRKSEVLKGKKGMYWNQAMKVYAQ